MVERHLIDTVSKHDERMRDLEVRMGQQDIINRTEEARLANLVTDVSSLLEDFTAFGLVLSEIKATVNGGRPNGRRGQIYDKAKVPVEAGLILTLIGVVIERLLS